MKYPKEYLDEIKTRLKVSTVVSKTVSLKKWERNFVGDFMKPIDSFESVSKLDKLIREYEVDTIYTHWAGDANQDHIATFKTTMASGRYVPNVFCYEQIPIPRHTENPMSINYYSDITDTFDTKIKASECHKSQYKKYKAAGKKYSTAGETDMSNKIGCKLKKRKKSKTKKNKIMVGYKAGGKV